MRKIWYVKSDIVDLYIIYDAEEVRIWPLPAVPENMDEVREGTKELQKYFK